MAETKFLIHRQLTVKRKSHVAIFIAMTFLIFSPQVTCANPWLPKPGGWKYNLQYSKYNIPKSIKFYETDLYFLLEKKNALLFKELAQFNNDIATDITNKKASLLALYGPGAALDQAYSQNLDLQILYNRRNNMVNDVNNESKQLKQLQNYLITSYHHWSATTDIEYGLNDHFSYGASIGSGRETDKYKTNTKVDKFSIFFKRKLYDKKRNIFTIQSEFLTIGAMRGVDLTAMLGKSHIMTHKVFKKKVEVFGYSSFGVTRFLNSNIMKNKIHAEITSGIKWDDNTILMNKESEDFYPDLNKTYKKVLFSQFTVAQDLNFASIEPRNKVYLTLSYFTIDSLKARRRLSTGYSVGLWLEL